jgi:hypothetical protein
MATPESVALNAEVERPPLQGVVGGLATAEQVGVITAEEEKLSLLDLFKRNFDHMVTSIEVEDASALEYVKGVMQDLRTRRMKLNREVLKLEHQALGQGYTKEIIACIVLLDAERIQIYHELSWAFGYLKDRL